MTSLRSSLAACAMAMFAASTALANQDLATKKACMACHQVDRAVVGPSFKDVAKKYGKQKDAAAKLTQKVLKGGGGVWGNNMMPANPQVSQAEAQQLVKWVLSLK